MNEPLFHFCPEHPFYFIAEPFSAISSLFISIIGLVIFAKEYKSKNKIFLWWAVLIILGGFSSALMHSSNNLLTRSLDSAAMIVIPFYILNLYLPNHKKIINYSTILALVLLPFATIVSFAIFLLGVFALLIFSRREDKFLMILIFGAAAILWLIDVTKFYCPDLKILTGHSIWHYLLGIGLFLWYKKLKTTS